MPPDLQLMIFNGLGAIIATLMGLVLFFLKRLIDDVKQTTAGVTILSSKFENIEKSNIAMAIAQEHLSERIRKVEISVAVLERDMSDQM